jgi:hypothetical protein
MKFNPSSAHRWTKCAAYAVMSNLVQKKKSTWQADEGTLTMKLIELAIEYNIPACNVSVPSELSHIPLTEKMVNDAQRFVDFVNEKASTVSGAIIEVEKRVDLDHVGVNNNSYIDIAIQQPFGKCILIDYKNGKTPVRAKENSQLLCNAVSMLKSEIGFDSYELIIYQPNCPTKSEPVDSWSVSIEEVKQFETELIKQVKLSNTFSNIVLSMIFGFKNKAQYIVAGEHCKWCEAAMHCPEQVKRFKGMRKTASKHIETLTDETLEEIYKNGEVITEFVKQAQAEYKNRVIKAPEKYPYALEETQGNRVWSDAEMTEIYLKKEGYEDKLFNPRTLKSPAQMEKAGVPTELIKKLTTRKITGRKLVPKGEETTGSIDKLFESAIEF